MTKLRKILWDAISIVCIIFYFYFLIKGDTYNANFMLIMALISDNRLDIIELKEKHNINE